LSIKIRIKNLRSLSGTAQRLRGLLIRAASDLTVLMAACFAFRPTLRAESESADKDFSEDPEVDGERACLRLGMVVNTGQVFFVYYLD